MKQILTTSLALVALVALACDSQAFWGHRGSYGGYGSSGSYGSYGGYGSSGSYGSYSVSYGSSGSYGGYGSSGSYGNYGSSGSYGSFGGIFARHHARKVARRMARGSYGSYGSYGSSGSYGSYGSSGSYGGYGSSGSYGSYSTPVNYESHGSDCGCADCSGSTTEAYYTKSSTTSGSGLLRVSVPADAVVYVNGKETTSTGTERQFISHGLESGRSYSYDVRVEYTVDGKTVTEERQVSLAAGGEELLAFAAPAKAESVATTLNLHVPADAKVTLAGVTTERTGADREYVTTKLPAGQEWGNYQVVVEHAGERQEKTITLVGGEQQTLDFHFAGSQVALRD